MSSIVEWLALLCALWLPASLLAAFGFGRWLRWRMRAYGGVWGRMGAGDDGQTDPNKA